MTVFTLCRAITLVDLLWNDFGENGDVKLLMTCVGKPIRTPMIASQRIMLTQTFVYAVDD